MPKATLDEVVEAVRMLTRGEQAKLRAQLDVLLGEPEAVSPEEQVERALLERGLLSEIRKPVTDLGPYRDRRLVDIQGKPLSETIVEGRR